MIAEEAVKVKEEEDGWHKVRCSECGYETETLGAQTCNGKVKGKPHNSKVMKRVDDEQPEAA